MAKIINMRCSDNTLHSIICGKAYQVQLDGNIHYVLEYIDRTNGNSSSFTVLEMIDGKFYQKVLGSEMRYRVFWERIKDLPKFGFNVLELPEVLELSPNVAMVNNPGYGGATIVSENKPTEKKTLLVSCISTGQYYIQGQEAYSLGLTKEPNEVRLVTLQEIIDLTQGMNVELQFKDVTKPILSTNQVTNTTPLGETASNSTEKSQITVYEERLGSQVQYALSEEDAKACNIERNFLDVGIVCAWQSGLIKITLEEFNTLSQNYNITLRPIPEKKLIYLGQSMTMTLLSARDALFTPKVDPFIDYKPLTKVQVDRLSADPCLVFKRRLINIPEHDPIQIVESPMENGMTAYFVVDYVAASVIKSIFNGTPTGRFIQIQDPEILELLQARYKIEFVNINEKGIKLDFKK